MSEARILANRLCLNPTLVAKWMRSQNLGSILGLMQLYPGKTHEQAMALARDAIWEYWRDQITVTKRKAAAPLKPAKPQEPCDVGLFSDDANQTDLVALAQSKQVKI
jgi:hypothetical protein